MFYLAWLLLIIPVTMFGSKKQLGGFVTFLISLIFTPLIGLIAVLLVGDKKVLVQNQICEFCGFKSPRTTNFCPGCDRDDLGHTKEYYVAKANPALQNEPVAEHFLPSDHFNPDNHSKKEEEPANTNSSGGYKIDLKKRT